MRILYVIDSLVPSGAERSLAEMIPGLGEEGVHPTVAYLHDRPGLQAQVEEAGAALASVAGPGGRRRWVARLRTLIQKERPHIVHTTLAEADLAGRIAGRMERSTVVSSLVNDQFGPAHIRGSGIPRWKLGAARAADAFTARWVTRFHAITDHVARAMAERLRVPRDRIDVIPRGRDPDRLGRRSAERGREARARLGLGDEPLVLAVARHERQKGIDVLLDAFPSVRRRVPGALLAVAGREGNETEALRRRAAGLGIAGSVRLLGQRADVPDLLTAADAFAFPSRWEGLGSVLLEAMALEAPIVATDLPALREVVADGETALLVPPAHVSALADRLVDTLADPSASATRAAAARSRFLDRYTIDRVVAEMIGFYRRALAT
jgi:glycosyltransferase involved in cell wall biosynthesis